MKTKIKKISFQNLHKQAILLTPVEKEKLISILRSSYSVFAAHENVSACPHCASKHVVKNGTRGGFHRYICRKCKRSFTFRTNSSLQGIHKINAWNIFLQDFMSLNVTPVRVLKKELGVSEQTVFNWRHKLLAALVSKEVHYTSDILEFDELNFLISRKGRQEMGITPKNKHQYKQWRKSQVGDSKHTVKVFATYGRNNGLLDLYKSNMGRTRKSDMKEYFRKDKFKDITVYSDRHHTYKGFFRDEKIPHETFLSTKEHVSYVNYDVHNQTVNSYAKGLKGFLNNHLRGVSTKYVDSYLKWYQFLQATKTQLNRMLDTDEKVKFDIRETLCKEIVHDKNGLELYRRKEFAFTAYLRKNGRTNYGTCKNSYYNVSVADIGTQLLLPPPKN